MYGKLEDAVQNQVLRLFAIRFQIWRGESLSTDDDEFWNAAITALPDCPVFKRLNLSPDEWKVQEEVEQSLEEEFGALFANADRVAISDEGHGVQTFSATYDLTKDGPTQRKSWWKRILHKN